MDFNLGLNPTQMERSIFNVVAVYVLTFMSLVSYYYFRNTYSYWHSKNVKGPRPWPVVGNLVQFIMGDRTRQELEWSQTYGKVYGIYFGSQRQLFIADPEVLTQLCIKDFDVAPNHESDQLFNRYFESFLFFSQDDHWRKLRTLMSPTFTSGKIKRMFRLLDTCANDLVECCREHLEEGKDIVDMKEIYSLYAMDSIATCCHGLKLERSGSRNIRDSATRNKFVGNAMKVFDLKMWRLLVSFIMPKRLLISMGYQIKPESDFAGFISIIEKLLESRKNSRGKKLDDYLQLLVDTEIDNELELSELDNSENHHAGLTCESLIEDQRRMMEKVRTTSNGQISSSMKSGAKIKLTELEVLAAAMLLLVVGVETTGTLLTHASYILAFHRDIQERLYEEVRAIARLSESGDGTFAFDYEKITTCNYLDAFVSETLRYLSPLTFTDRILSQDYRIEKYNLDLPRGLKINLALHAIMNNPDYWEEPEKFNPERFMPENKHKIVPGSYCPFGVGPRHCIGMRFSLTEAKLGLAKMVLSHRFEPAPKTKFPPAVKAHFGLGGIKNANVRLIPRPPKG